MPQGNLSHFEAVRELIKSSGGSVLPSERVDPDEEVGFGSPSGTSPDWLAQVELRYECEFCTLAFLI